MNNSHNHQILNSSIILLIGEFLDRLNFYGIQSVLILYLIHIMLLSNHNTLAIYAAYSSLGFILPIVGGYIVDKFLLNRYKFILFGIIFIIFGNIILLLYSNQILLFGLSLVIIGIGIVKSNNIALFGTLYEKSPEKRSSAFAYYYAVMNAGAIAGPIFYGSVTIVLGWKHGFIISIAGFSISLFLYIIMFRSFPTNNRIIQNRNRLTLYKIALWGTSIFGCVYLSLNYYSFLLALLLGSIIAVAWLFFNTVKPLAQSEKNKVILLIISMCYGIFFYASSLQISSSLLMYINSNVNTTILNFTIPPEYFMSVSSIFIIILTPISSKLWTKYLTQESSLIGRVNLSIYLAALSFILVAFSSLCTTKYNINWKLILIIAGLIALSVGELSIGPVVISAVTYLAPANRIGIFMGVWYLFIGYSAYISSLIAEFANINQNFIKYGNAYFQNFLLVALATLLVAISMTLMKRYLKSLCLN